MATSIRSFISGALVEADRLFITQRGTLFSLDTGPAALIADDNGLATISGFLRSVDDGLTLLGDNAGVRVFASGTIETVDQSSVSSGTAITFEGIAGTVANKGIISSQFGDAIRFLETGDYVKNYGTIEAGRTAIEAYQGLSSVRNVGSITGEAFSIFASNLTGRFAYNGEGGGIISGDISLQNAPSNLGQGHSIFGGRASGTMTVEFSRGNGADYYNIFPLNNNSDQITVYGFGGDDEIRGATIAYGGDGKDTLIYNVGDLAEGGNGDDLIDGYSNANGGNGNDTVLDFIVATGGAGDDLLENQGFVSGSIARGGDGNDTITWAMTAYGDAGDDVISIADIAYGGDGNDTMTNIETAFGNAGNDTITGHSGSSVLNGGAGDDLLHGGAGAHRDILNGGFGDDILDGGDNRTVSDQRTASQNGDRAVYSGNQADFLLVREMDGSVTITDLNLSDGDMGTDTLINIEAILFSDTGVLVLDDLI